MKMMLKQLTKQLGFSSFNDCPDDVEITSGYASDLLSDVLANAGEGCIWITNQKHQNIVGVAVMINLAAVVIAGGISPDENTLEKAKEENVPLLSSDDTMFDVVGKLYELGIRSC